MECSRTTGGGWGRTCRLTASASSGPRRRQGDRDHENIPAQPIAARTLTNQRKKTPEVLRDSESKTACVRPPCRTS